MTRHVYVSHSVRTADDILRHARDLARSHNYPAAFGAIDAWVEMLLPATVENEPESEDAA